MNRLNYLVTDASRSCYYMVTPREARIKVTSRDTGVRSEVRHLPCDLSGEVKNQPLSHSAITLMYANTEFIYPHCQVTH
jgi:hypothetical protein